MKEVLVRFYYMRHLDEQSQLSFVRTLAKCNLTNCEVFIHPKHSCFGKLICLLFCIVLACLHVSFGLSSSIIYLYDHVLHLLSLFGLGFESWLGIQVISCLDRSLICLRHSWYNVFRIASFWLFWVNSCVSTSSQ